MISAEFTSYSDVAIQQTFQSRLEDRTLLLDCPAQPVKDDKKGTIIDKKIQKKLLNSKQKKKLGIFNIPASSLKYDDLLSLHHLWTSYITELLNTSSNNDVSAKLCKADYHGCIFKVVKSKSQPQEGIEGIMIKETKNTFQILTKANQVKLIPKKTTWISFVLENKEHVLFCAQFIGRSGERIAKKFKGTSSVKL